LTAHGSGGEALLDGGAVTDGAIVAGAVIDAVDVGCGVFATVESPEPQPVNVGARSMAAAPPVNNSARQGNDHTSKHRTAIGATDAAGVAGPRALAGR
jgi:hypothetical protein